MREFIDGNTAIARGALAAGGPPAHHRAPAGVGRPFFLGYRSREAALLQGQMGDT